jgi:signal transduction histidine kinase
MPATLRRARPPVTIRLRLTALYSGLFLAAGGLLLTLAYLLVEHQLNQRFGSGMLAASDGGILHPSMRSGSHGSSSLGEGKYFTSPQARELVAAQLKAAVDRQRTSVLHQLLIQSGLGLAIVAVAAVGVGWLMAGRALRPLRDIIATARRLSTRNLSERISLPGPQDELKEVADTIDEMLGRLAAGFEAQRRFVANASHELRTPLTVQRAAIDVALSDPHPTIESLRAMAARVRVATERHERLIDSLLMLAGGERGVQRYEPVDLAQAVQNALTAAQPAIEDRRLRVTSSLRPAALDGDRDLLAGLAANLVDNAVKYNVAGGEIHVETATDGSRVALSISNTGPELPADMVGQLFQPFRRHAPDRTVTGPRRGFGLGLSIVAAITDAHRGVYQASARQGGGLSIAVTFPDLHADPS